MELQLCEERRQMMDVEREVKKRFVAFTSSTKAAPQQQQQHTQSRQGTVVEVVKASEEAAAATAVRAMSSTKTSQKMRRPDNKNALIKYSDRFRRC